MYVGDVPVDAGIHNICSIADLRKCPMFIRIDHLMNGGFIKDDSIFLRIVVDTADLPRIIP